MTLTEVELKILELEKKMEKYSKKEAKGELSSGDIRARGKLRDELRKYQMMKDRMTGKEVVPTETPKVETADKPEQPPTVPSSEKKEDSTTSSTEKRLKNVEEKASEAADAMNTEEEKEKKTEDAWWSTSTALDMANQIDANVEENVPTWFWREAQEMSPTDKAKRGFIIANHVLNRLGTTTGNIGSIIQNAGGSGGAPIKQHGGSYIDQYRQSKIEQAMANRKLKQDTLLKAQTDALAAVTNEENAARAIQNKLRNSKHWHNYNRLTNEQQVYIQGLLFSDTKGEINDAVLGNFIDQLMEGKDMSLEDMAVSTLTAAGIDNVDEIKSGATSIKDKILKRLNLK